MNYCYLQLCEQIYLKNKFTGVFTQLNVFTFMIYDCWSYIFHVSTRLRICGSDLSCHVTLK